MIHFSRIAMAAGLGLAALAASNNAMAQAVVGQVVPGDVVVTDPFAKEVFFTDHHRQQRYYPQFQPPLPLAVYPPQVSHRKHERHADRHPRMHRKVAAAQKSRHAAYRPR